MLRGIAIVVLQHAAETLSAFNLTCDASDFLIRLYQLVVDSLVISFGRIVSNVFFQGPFEGVLPEEKLCLR